MNMSEHTEIRPAVAAAIFNEKGEILLQKRRDTNQWCIISGHVEFGETVENAMLREIFEETNTPARILRFIGIYSSPSSQTYYYPHKTVQYITSYFEARLLEELDTAFNNNETQELRYFPLHSIPGDIALINPNWLHDALDRSTMAFIR